MHAQSVPVRRWSSRPSILRPLVLLGALLLVVAAAPAHAWVTLTGANGVSFDLNDTGSGGLAVQNTLNGYPELCVRVCDACESPCGPADLYDARGAASVSELVGLQRALAATVVNGLQVVRKVYVPNNNPANANGFVRYLDIISNPGAAAVQLSVRIGTSGATGARLNQGPDTAVWRTHDDDAEAEITDRWILTDDLDAFGGRPTAAHLVHGAGARYRPARFGLGYPIAGDQSALAWDFHNVVVGPGETVIFMTLIVVETTREPVIAEVQNLVGMTSEVLYGLTVGERSRIANFDIDPANPSPVADAGGPYNTNEGEQVQLSAARSVDPVDNQLLTYEWDTDGDGDFGDAQGANTIVTFPDDGVYQLNVRVTDPQGKRDVDSARIVVRNVAPRVEAVTTDSPINEGGLLTVEVVTLEPGQDALTFDFDWEGDGQYDDQALRQNRASHQYFADGVYSARVRVSDDDGGMTEFDFPAVVNNLPPTLFEVVGNWPQLEGAEVSIQVIAQDPGRDPVMIGYDLDNDGVFELEGLDLDETTYRWPDNGQYPINIRLTDDQGAETIGSELISILNAHPVIAGIRNTGPVFEGSPVDIVVDASDTPLDTLSYSFDLDNDGSFADDVVDQAPSTYTTVYRQQGVFIVGVRVRDEDNGLAVGSTAVEVLNAAPTGTISAPEFVDEGERFTVSVVASDPGDDPVLFDWDVDGDGNFDLINSIQTEQALVFNQEGEHIISVRVHDRDGGELLLNAVVRVRNVEPLVECRVAEPVIEGADTAISCTAVDAGADDLLFAFDFNGDGAFEVEGLGSGEASFVYEDQGIFTMTCAVDDGSNIIRTNVLVIVENAPPRLTLRADAPVDEGGEIRLTATAFDPSPQDTVTLEWDLDGDGVVDVRDDPALERTIPALDDARYLVTLIGRDEDGGESSVQAQIIVRNLPPRFEDIAQLPPAREGDVWSYVMPVVDPGGAHDPLEFELLNPPVGVEIDPTSGFISWVPTYDQYRASPISIGIAVNDGDGGRAQTEIIVPVEFRDQDLDGLPDSWEVVTCDEAGNCLDPNDPNDAAADPDMDGRSTLEEFATGDDPYDYDGPPQPENLDPENGIRVLASNPPLVIDPKDGDGNPDTLFVFEVFADADLQTKVIESEPIVRGNGQTVSYTLPEGILIEDATYWWHARAILGPARTPFTEPWSFTVNAVNNKPTTPVLRAPQDGEEVTIKFPTFAAEPCTDLDGDDISYTFTLYNARGVVETNGQGELNPETMMIEFRPLQALTENAAYTWKVVAVDELNEASDPSEIWAFTVNTENIAPDAPTWVSPEKNETVTTLRPTLKATGTRDLDGDPVSLVFRIRYADADGMLTEDAPLVESEPVAVDGAGSASYTVPLDLEENADFIAEVWATDGQANSDIVSQPFYVSVTDEPPPAPALTSPVDGSRVSPKNLFLDWEDVADPEGTSVIYIMTYCQALEGGNERCDETAELKNSGFAFLEPVQGATYRWSVVAIDESGLESPAGQEWSFVVDVIDSGGGGGGGGSGGGCTAAPGVPVVRGSLGLLLLGGLLLRRRRRR